uniref:NR LBD domain-containing protein n=1 Tax=Tetranychus urticae TaxID=32264 RepID=T1JYL0_TETUR
MDLSEFLNFHQPSTSPLMKTTDLQNNNAMISLSQSKVSNINKRLLQVLSPSEETLKTFLYSDQHKINNNTDKDQSINSLKTVIVNIDRFHIKISRRFGPKRSQLNYINLYDATSESIYSDTIHHIVFSIVNHNNLSLASLDINDYENSETLNYQCYDDYQALQPTQQFTYNDYVKLKSNTLLLTRLGYKFAITLNTDNVKPETWNSKVAKKILSVGYSVSSLLKDCYHTQAPLDQLEPFFLELVNAFQDDEPINLPDFAKQFKTNPSPVKFVSICRKLRNFKKLCDNDKIMLFSSSFYDLLCMNSVFKFNETTDEWMYPEYGVRFGRRDLFIWDRLLHDATLRAIEALPDRWRKDEVVEALISLIVIFNPDELGLNFPDLVRLACQLFSIQL